VDSAGQPHGRRAPRPFLPHEGPNDIAAALFSFPSLAACEACHSKIREDEDCRKASRHAEGTRCIVRYERSFLTPVLE
jgi:hypothetical protein